MNCSRGPVIDEAALVDHLRENPMFRVGLDVFEVQSYAMIEPKKHKSFILFLQVMFILHYFQEEPFMKPGLADMKNAIVVPHIASASKVCPTEMFLVSQVSVK